MEAAGDGPAAVLGKIEAFMLSYLDHLTDEGIPPDMIVSEQCRSLYARQGTSAASYVRLFCILQHSHELLRSGRRATQRGIYYRLKEMGFISTPEQVNQAILDAAAILQLSRSDLGYACAARGLCAGYLLLRDRDAETWVDCRESSALGGFSIPGDAAVLSRLEFRIEARCIVVVEKHAVFKHLLEDGFHEMTQGILITAKGMPDVATRAFLHCLHTEAPMLPILAVIDWNPSGVLILSTYKYGGSHMRLEAAKYALPSIQWLGVRGSMLHGSGETSFQPLIDRDRSLISFLRTGPLQEEGAWLEELSAMQEMNAKAEIESLYEKYGLGGFVRMLAEKAASDSVLSDCNMEMQMTNPRVGSAVLSCQELHVPMHSAGLLLLP